MKKIGEYPHNGYPTNMGTGTGQIFISWVGYGGAVTRTLPAPLTSLVMYHEFDYKLHKSTIIVCTGFKKKKQVKSYLNLNEE